MGRVFHLSGFVALQVTTYQPRQLFQPRLLPLYEQKVDWQSLTSHETVFLEVKRARDQLLEAEDYVTALQRLCVIGRATGREPNINKHPYFTTLVEQHLTSALPTLAKTAPEKYMTIPVMLWSLGHPEAGKALLEEWEDKAYKCVQSGTTEHLCTLPLALADAGLFANDLVEEVLEELSCRPFTVVQASTLLKGVTAYTPHVSAPPSGLLRAIATSLHELTRKTPTPKEVSAVVKIWAGLVSVGWVTTHPPTLSSADEARTSSTTLEEMRMLLEALGHAAEKVWPRWSPSQAVTVARAMRDGPRVAGEAMVLEGLIKLLKEPKRLQEIDGSSQAAIIGAMARVRMRPKSQVLRRIIDSGCDKMGEMGLAEVVEFVEDSVAVGGSFDGLRAVEAATVEVSSRLDEVLNDGGAAPLAGRLLCLCAEVRHRPETHVMRALESALLHQPTLAVLVDCVAAMAVLDHAPSDRTWRSVQAGVEEAVNSPAGEPSELAGVLCRVLWSLAVLLPVTSGAAQQMFTTCTLHLSQALSEWSEADVILTPAAAGQLILSLQCIRAAEAHDWYSPHCENLLTITSSMARTAFNGVPDSLTAQDTFGSPVRSSKLQKDIALFLQEELGARCLEEVPDVEPTGYSIDIVLPPQGGDEEADGVGEPSGLEGAIAIEVDGPFHFLTVVGKTATDLPSGPTRLKHRWLALNSGPGRTWAASVSISHTDWRSCVSRSDRLMLLWSKVNNTGLDPRLYFRPRTKKQHE